jgi:hypothetical protein
MPEREGRKKENTKSQVHLSKYHDTTSTFEAYVQILSKSMCDMVIHNNLDEEKEIAH